MIFYIVIFLLFLFLVFNILYFILPSLSPIPFYPTNKKDLPKIAAILLNLRVSILGDPQPQTLARIGGKMRQAPQIIVDLGAGTGTVIFAAARIYSRNKKQVTSNKFIAVEIHPLLIAIMHLKRLFHPARDNIKIIRADIFKIDFQKFIKQVTRNQSQVTIYIYVGPFVMPRLIPRLATLPTHTRIVSYMYEVPGWEKKIIKTVTGVNKIYEYEI